jgi:hypothetical protein
MHTIEALKTFSFTVYKQVIRGQISPVTFNKQNSKTTLNLVRSANNQIIYSAVSREEVEQFVTSSDFTIYGYHSPEDFEITYNRLPKSNLHQAVITPKRIYPLCEDISLPDPPDEKSKTFFDFIADEFERIKIRAEQIMHTGLSNKKISQFACRKLQMLRKLSHDARLTFNKMCSNNNSGLIQSDLYIIYVLNLFIIRSIVFYTQFFEPYLNKEPLDEQSLRDTFHNKMPRKPKYSWIFIHRPLLYEDLPESDCSSQAFETNPAYHQPTSNEKNNIPSELLNEAIELLQMKGFMQLNCNINVFLNEIFKMYYDKDSDGLTIFSAERKKLVKLLSYIVADNEGKLLNPHTISSVIKPSNIKKRPGI